MTRFENLTMVLTLGGLGWSCSTSSSTGSAESASSTGGASSGPDSTSSTSNGPSSEGGGAPEPPDDPAQCLAQTSEFECVLMRCHWRTATHVPDETCVGSKPQPICTWSAPTDFLGTYPFYRGVEDGTLLLLSTTALVGFTECVNEPVCGCELLPG